jgi:predicted negative regulator of RcsB-dependent stress response
VDEYLTETEQWEWIKGQVRENAPAVVLTIALMLAAVAGWRWWQQRQDGERLQAGASYMQMVQALERGDRSQAMLALGQLEREHAKSPYTDQARLLAARLHVEGNEADKAAAELAAVAEHSQDRELATVARERLARVQIAQGKPDAALTTLAGTEIGAFAGRFHEVRGDAYYAKGDKAAALAEYRSAKAGSSGGSTPLLDLKIADLTPEGTPNSASAPAAATQ